jgi:hypothetical protein
LPACKPSVSPVAPLTTFSITKNPFEEIALDFADLLPPTARRNDFLLNITDRLTKVVVPVPCSQSTSKYDLAHTLFHVIFCRFGIPLVLISDRDPRIDNEFFSRLASFQGTSQRLTSAHRPQGNGQAEGTKQEIVTKLKMYCSSYPHDWDQKVFRLAYAYNTTVHTVLGETPFYCLHGYHPSSA